MAIKIAIAIAIAIMGSVEISADQNQTQEAERSEFEKQPKIKKTKTRKQEVEKAISEAAKIEAEERMAAQLEAERQRAIQTAAKEKEALEAAKRLQKQEVLFTNYYLDDGSRDMTASGLNTKDFGINNQGFYTYQGKVVLATANKTRMDWPLKSGYKSKELYTELTIELNGQKYEAIVLDVCGACYGIGQETKQRYDIFATHNAIGKRPGAVYD